MKVTVIPGRELGHDLLLRWAELQQSNPALASPHFSPEFTLAVAMARKDVEVAVIEDGNAITAFFPFQRNGRVGTPVGGLLSDFQGLVCRPEFSLNAAELVKTCGLVAFDFDHLLASQTFFAPYHRHVERSPQLDVSNGYEAYVAERRAAGSEQIKKCGNLMRRLEREFGSLRFVDHAADARVLKKVLSWKSQQYLEGGKNDLFALDWFRDIVERIHATQAGTFRGMLSLLYVGERLIAGHMGMRTPTVWHYWFPAYDPACAKYSPGLVLLLKMTEHAANDGVHLLDLGKGMTLYKERLMNASVPLASGSVELPSWLSFRRGARRKLRKLAINSPFAGPARQFVRWTRRKEKSTPS